MKKVFILTFIMAIGGAIIAQDKPSTGQTVFNQKSRIVTKNETNILVKDEDLDKYVGTWKQTAGGITYSLTLNRTSKNFGTSEKPLILELVTGKYQTLQNGKVVDEFQITGSSQGKSGQIYLMVYDPKTSSNTEYIMHLPAAGGAKIEISDRKREKHFVQRKTTAIPPVITLQKI